MGDKHGRFAAMVMMGHHLAIMPALEADQFERLRQQQQHQGEAGSNPHDHMLQKFQDGSSQPSCLGPAAALGNSFLLDLSKLGVSAHQTHSAGGSRSGRGGGGGGAGGAGMASNGVQGIRDVIDCVLLNGYTDPVLLLLHQPDPTWVGRYR